MSLELPEGWRTVMLGELASSEPYSCVGGPFGSNLTTKDYIAEPGVPVIRGGNVPEDGPEFVDSGFVYVSHEKADLLRKNMAYPGDLIFTQRGTLGQIGLIPSNARHQRYVVSQSQMKLRPNSALVSSEFLFQYFRSPVGKKMVLDSAIATGVPHINLGILKGFTLSLPSLREQEKIAEILTSVDDAIQATEAVIEQTKKVKQGVMNRLLTKGIGHTRFKQTEIGEIPEEWRVTTLGEVCGRSGLQTGPFGSQLHAHDYIENEMADTKVVMPKSIVRNAIDFDLCDAVDVAKATEMSRHLLVIGDILFSRRGDLSKIAQYKTGSPKALCGTGCLRARLDRSQVDPDFLTQQVTTSCSVDWLEQHASGQTMLNLNTSVVSRLPVRVPPLREQEKIARILSGFDDQVEKLEGEQHQAMALKSTLLADLLTGRKRVVT